MEYLLSVSGRKVGEKDVPYLINEFLVVSVSPTGGWGYQPQRTPVKRGVEEDGPQSRSKH